MLLLIGKHLGRVYDSARLTALLWIVKHLPRARQERRGVGVRLEGVVNRQAGWCLLTVEDREAAHAPRRGRLVLIAIPIHITHYRDALVEAMLGLGAQL